MVLTSVIFKRIPLRSMAEDRREERYRGNYVVEVGELLASDQLFCSVCKFRIRYFISSIHFFIYCFVFAFSGRVSNILLYSHHRIIQHYTLFISVHVCSMCILHPFGSFTIFKQFFLVEIRILGSSSDSFLKVFSKTN